MNTRGLTNRINYLLSEIEGIYHESSVTFGISDSISIVLYTLYNAGGSCHLKDIYASTGVSKQTINSATKKLEKEGLIKSELLDGKSKKLTLTKKGSAFSEKTVKKLIEAEDQTFRSWSSEDVSQFMMLLEAYIESFKKEVRAIGTKDES